MNDWLDPDPEESGLLVPPSRRPPTALGLATPPTPLPRRHRFGWERWSPRRHPLVRSAEWMTIGAAIALVTPWTIIRVAGIVVGSLGFGAGATWLTRRVVARAFFRGWNRWKRATRSAPV
jgi:hypothetical protein